MRQRDWGDYGGERGRTDQLARTQMEDAERKTVGLNMSDTPAGREASLKSLLEGIAAAAVEGSRSARIAISK